MKKVVIGMSGGVDSAVSAYLLKQQDYEVIGLFMRNWDSTANNDILGNPNTDNDICPQEQDYNDALEVCNKLNIPLYRVNFVKEYWDYVFKYFLEELKNNRTPNPDVMCNRYIKFDLFIKEAQKYNPDYIATGHYAILKDDKLYKAFDKNKDQSYFLSMVKNFKNVLFPLGEINKEEVRKIANELGLNIANKKDSTGICFIGERNFKKFLKNYLPNQKGTIVDIETNEILGEHIGLMYYTIGQRRGMNIGSKDKLYVVKKDLEKNILYVCHNENNKYLISNKAIIEQINWINDKKIKNCNVKFRYRQPDINASIEYISKDEAIITYNDTKAVTEGQICVFYDNEECLGGGIIKKTFYNY